MFRKSLRAGAARKMRAVHSVIEPLEDRLFLAAQSIISLTLINADTQQAITGFNPIPAGATLNFATLGTKDLNILVNTSPATVGSVGFNYDGNATYHIENTAPYDIGGDTSGVYAAWTPALGTHTLIVTPFSGSNLSGTAGTSLSETFTVTNTTTTESPFLGTPFAVPGTIMADNFDNGGQGIAYNDTTPGNQGGSYRSTDVDIEPNSDATPPGLTTSSPGVGFDVGHIVASEYINYTVNVAATGTFAFDVRIASGGPGGTFHIDSDGVNVTGSMAFKNTGGWQTWQTVTANSIALTAGQHILKLVFDTSNGGEIGNVYYLNIRSLAVAPPAETPFLGSPLAVPATIMADNFDNGGEGVAYNDTTPGNQGGSYRSTDVDIEPTTDVTPPGMNTTSAGVGFEIGHIAASEYLNYTISVATAGMFAFDVRFASGGNGGTFQINSDGVNVTGSMTLPNTGGWQTWKTQTINNISLAAGTHILSLVFDSSFGGELGNVYYIGVRSLTTTPPPPTTESPFLGSAIALPGTFMADNFDNGGQGIAYSDTTPGNQGSGTYRNTDVDIDTATDASPPGLTSTSPGVGFSIGHIQPGEWLNYTVDIATAGAYDIAIRVASAQSGIFHINIDGAKVTGSINLPNTGGWTTWQTVTAPGITLPAGQHILQIMFDSSPYSEMGNVEYLQITSSTTTGTNLFKWNSIAPSPIPRGEGEAAVVNGLLYSFGGFDDSAFDAVTRSDAYNPANNTWTQIANLPEALTHGATVVVGNVVWIIGGFVGNLFGQQTADVWEYNTVTNTYTAGPSLPSAIGAGAAALLNGQIHFFGGLIRDASGNPTNNTNEHWDLNLSNLSAGWTNLAPMPDARNHMAGAALDGLIYAIGGQNLQDETNGNSAEVDVYNPTTNTWTQGPSLPVARGHINPSTFVYNGRILVIGGTMDGDVADNEVTSFDPASNAWVELPPLPEGHKSPSAGAIGNLLVVVGGDNPNPSAVAYSGTLSGSWHEGATMPVSLGEAAGGIIGTNMYVVGQESATTYVYNLVSGIWSTAAPRSFVGDHHAAEVFNGELYLIGGLDNGSPGQVQIYNPTTNTWSLGAPMPWSGGSVSTALINGKIYAAGGIINSTTTTNLAAVYDPVANTWTSIAPMPMGVNHAAAQTDGTKFYIFGGRIGGNVLSTGFNYVQIYNPATNTWTSSTTPGSTIAPLPQARGGMGKAVFYNGEFYIMGGETSDPTVPNGVYNRVDIYNPTTNTWRLGTPMPTARHGIFPLLFDDQIYVAGGGVHSDDSNSSLLEIYTL